MIAPCVLGASLKFSPPATDTDRSKPFRLVRATEPVQIQPCNTTSLQLPEFLPVGSSVVPGLTVPSRRPPAT
ncbi:MAG: hypothetical protein P8Y21_13290 [Gemmatimonadales bacterium]